MTRRLLAALAAAVVLLAPLPAAADPAPTDTPRDLTTVRAQADALRAQVERLETEVEVAAEEHAQASEELAVLVTRELAADAALSDAQQAGNRERGQAGRRARAVYMAGGHFGLVAGVLEGSDPGDVLARYRTVQLLVAADAGTVRAAEAVEDDAVDASRELQRLRAQRQQLELTAEQTRTRAETALAQHRALLAEADAHVVELVDQERREAEEAALRAAEASIADLGALPQASAPTEAAAYAIEAASSMLGRPYQWGAVGPGTFDCSGLTMWAYRQAGVSIPRTSRSQFAGLPKVAAADLAPGDLIFWAHGASPGSIHHVGLYVGAGKMIHAPRTGDVVRVAAVHGGVYGVARPTAGH